jgi:DHA2 family multidrug resistance protein
VTERAARSAGGALAAASTSSNTSANASLSDWIAVGAGALGALMATLDISIANSALPQIQGGIGATGTEGTWISTGYLMSEIVMIPLAAWLTRVFGLRNFLSGNALLFMLFSIMCGMSHSLAQMIIGRIGQGFTGGALIPTAQTIVATRLPPHQIPIGMTGFGLIVLLGPLLGPVAGGWLTQNIDWSWCFFVNLPICTALLVLLYVGLPKAPPDWRQFIKADWVGIVGLAAGLGSLTVVLEEGQREGWFDSQLIVWLSVVAVAGIALTISAQFIAKTPIIRMRLLANKSYASVILIVFTTGAGLYCVAYVLPQFLSGIASYNAEQSGMVMLLSGVPAFLMVPALPRLIGRFDARIVVIAGLCCFAGSCMLDVGLTAQSVGHDFYGSQLLRGLGQMLAMMPLNRISMSAASPAEAGDAAGLFNMARNLGGSVGLALLRTFLDRRDAFHGEVIRESLTANSAAGQEHIAASAAGFFAQHGDPAFAKLQSLGQLAAQIQQQAAVITYSETFYVLAVALLLCIPLALLLNQPTVGTISSAGH